MSTKAARWAQHGRTGTKATGANVRDVTASLAPRETQLFLSGAGIAQYIALDRPDIMYAVKELRQATANPDVLAMLRLKRLTRYLRGEPDVEVRYYYEQPCAIPDIKATKNGKDGDGPVIKCFVDSDWAGDELTRKSTSSGVTMIDGYLIET